MKLTSSADVIQRFRLWVSGVSLTWPRNFASPAISGAGRKGSFRYGEEEGSGDSESLCAIPITGTNYIGLYYIILRGTLFLYQECNTCTIFPQECNNYLD